MPVLLLRRPLAHRLAMAAALSAALVCGPAVAAPAPIKAPAATVPPIRPEVAWTSAEPEAANCFRSRRKLFQPGEGWMVKTVTVCR